LYNKHGVLLWRWVHRLRRRVHPWPHEDGASPRVVEGCPRRGAAATTVIDGVVAVVTLALSFTLTLVFHLDLIEFEVVADDVEGGKGLRPMIKVFI
jgi:hypothetical protein